jgi:uncharacterized CHY-type Zn-finger protein
MSQYSGESDTESTGETEYLQYKCHICQFVPDINELIHILEKVVDIGPYLISLRNGQFYVRCQFADCERYFHLLCIHPTFPDEALNYSHLDTLKESGIHCPVCEPGIKIVNY